MSTTSISPPYHVEGASDSENEQKNSCHGVKVIAKTPAPSPAGINSSAFKNEQVAVVIQKKQKVSKEEKARKAAERQAKKAAAEEEKARKAAERQAKKAAAEEEKARKAAEREAKKKIAEEKKLAAEAEKAAKAAKRQAKKMAAEEEKAAKAAKREAKKKISDENPTQNTATILANLGIGETSMPELELKAEAFVENKSNHVIVKVKTEEVPDIDEGVSVEVEDLKPAVQENTGVTDKPVENSKIEAEHDAEDDAEHDAEDAAHVAEEDSPSDSLDLDAEDVSNKMNELRKIIKKQNELIEEQKKTAEEINRIYGELAIMFGESQDS